MLRKINACEQRPYFFVARYLCFPLTFNSTLSNSSEIGGSNSKDSGFLPVHLNRYRSSEGVFRYSQFSVLSPMRMLVTSKRSHCFGIWGHIIAAFSMASASKPNMPRRIGRQTIASDHAWWVGTNARRYHDHGEFPLTHPREPCL